MHALYACSWLQGVSGPLGKKACSIVLTTHTMEEAEALCTNVGVMVGGRLRYPGVGGWHRTESMTNNQNQ